MPSTTGATPRADLALREAHLRATRAERHATQISQMLAVVSRLHLAEDVDEVLLIVKETVANLVGCEHLGIYAVTGPGADLQLVDAIGLDPGVFAAFPPVPTGIGAWTSGGEVTRQGRVGGLTQMAGRPINAFLPLISRGRALGLIILFDLVVQKPALGPADADLLEFLAFHASHALGRLPEWPTLVGMDR